MKIVLRNKAIVTRICDLVRSEGPIASLDPERVEKALTEIEGTAYEDVQAVVTVVRSGLTKRLMDWKANPRYALETADAFIVELIHSTPVSSSQERELLASSLLSWALALSLPFGNNVKNTARITPPRNKDEKSAAVIIDSRGVSANKGKARVQSDIPDLASIPTAQALTDDHPENVHSPKISRPAFAVEVPPGAVPPPLPLATQTSLGKAGPPPIPRPAINATSQGAAPKAPGNASFGRVLPPAIPHAPQMLGGNSQPIPPVPLAQVGGSRIPPIPKRAKSSFPGWAIALLIIFLVGPVGILAVPAYHDYTVRAEVAQALNTLSEPKGSVSDYYSARGSWPKSLTDAGVREPFVTEFAQIAWDPENKVFHVKLQSGELAGKTVFNFVADNSEISIQWACGSSDIESRYLPADCRNAIDFPPLLAQTDARSDQPQTGVHDSVAGDLPQHQETSQSMAPANAAQQDVNTSASLTTPEPTEHRPSLAGNAETTVVDADTERAQALLNKMLEAALENNGAGDEIEIFWAAQSLENASSPPRGDRNIARSANELGLSLLRNGQTAEAISAFAQAHSADPSDIEIINNLGHAHLKNNDLAAAERYLRLALSFSPRRSYAWTDLGQAYGRKGDLQAAVASFCNAYRFSKNRAKLHDSFSKLLTEATDTGLETALQQAVVLGEKHFLPPSPIAAAADTPTQTASKRSPPNKAPARHAPIVRGAVDGVLDTAKVLVSGQAVEMYGLVGVRDPSIVQDMARFLNGASLVCEPRQSRYTCRMESNGRDLAFYILENGAARAARDAPSEYVAAETVAKDHQRGLFRATL